MTIGGLPLILLFMNRVYNEIHLGQSQHKALLVASIVGGSIAFVVWFATVLVFSLA